LIKHQEQITLDGLPVFTRISVETPLQAPLPLPSDACYLYIEAGEDRSPQPNLITFTPGTVILSTCGLTLGKMIGAQPSGSMDSIIVHLKRELLELVFAGEKPALWEELKTPVNQYVVQTAADELVRNYFNGIGQLFHNKAALTHFILKLKLKEIVLLLLQTDDSESVRQIVKSLFSERIFTFKELVDAHIFTSASLENLAQLTHCSLSTFKRKFKEIYHTSPGRYLTEKRLEKVAESLRISDEPVSQIGYAWGFESPEHLSRAFKKKYGLSPSAYRLNFSVK
jgi:AraC-like DNA-binding protein